MLSFWLDNGALLNRAGILGSGWAGRAQAHGACAESSDSAAIFFTFAYLKSSAALGEVSRQLETKPVGWGLLAAHFVAMGVFGGISWALYGNHLSGFPAVLAVSLWLITGGCGIAFAAFATIPLAMWLGVVRATGTLWVVFSGGNLRGVCRGILQPGALEPAGGRHLYLGQGDAPAFRFSDRRESGDGEAGHSCGFRC